MSTGSAAPAATASVVRRVVRRYIETNSEYAALQVVARGLFLSLVLVIAFLFVMAFVTDLISGQNEIVIPINGVDSAVDLGAVISDLFSRTSAAVITVTGAATFLASAFLTAKALRDGSRRALLGPQTPKSRWTDLRTLVIAMAISGLVLVTWLLALATALRRAAWSALFATDLPNLAVNLAKALCILLAAALIAGSVILVTRLITGGWPDRRGWLLSVAVGALVVAANFFLLYTYVGALVNPAVSAGIVLILTMMLWVNIVVRVYLAGLCWIAAGGRPV